MSSSVRRVLADGETVWNGWLSIPNGFAAEVMAAAPWSSLTVDLQHGIQDYQSLVQILQSLAASQIPVLARLSGNDPAQAGKALDAGVTGLICPLVNSAADATRFVRACRYPPDGDRSFGPTRAALGISSASYRQRATDEILCLAMIETAAGLHAVDEIGAVDGLDGFYVGPADLGLSLGLEPRLDSEEPAVLDAFSAILETARRRDLIPGIHTASPAYARRMAELGFRFITLGSDTRLLGSAARDVIAAAQS